MFQLIGGGEAHATFRVDRSAGGGYFLDAITFDFADSAAPIPEPGSLFLVGSCLAAACWRRMRRSD